jgi:hypothetical protein
MMQKICAGRIFADHYQFSIFDVGVNSADNMPDWTEAETSDLGYITNGRVIYVGTVADLNTHWIEIYLSDLPPDFDDCQKVLAINILVDSGAVIVEGMYQNFSCRIDVNNGTYIVYILGYNLGVEIKTLIPITDEELERRTELERYKIVLVLGRTENEGMLKDE